MYALPEDPNPHAWRRATRGTRVRRALRRALGLVLVAGVVGGGAVGVAKLRSADPKASGSTPSTSASPSPSPSASPSFTLGDVVRGAPKPYTATGGLELLEPGDCFDLVYDDSAHTVVRAMKVPSCEFPHRYEFVKRFDYNERWGSSTPPVAERQRVYDRDCNDATAAYTGVKVGEQNTASAPFRPEMYSGLRQPTDDLTTQCALVTAKYKAVKRSFRDWASSSH